MKTLSASPLLLSLVLASASLLPAAAEPQKASDFDAFAFRFQFDRAELDSEKSADKLLVRLESVVRRQCDANRKLSVTQRQQVEACIDRTMTGAINKFGSTTLSEVYRSRVAG